MPALLRRNVITVPAARQPTAAAVIIWTACPVAAAKEVTLHGKATFMMNAIPAAAKNTNAALGDGVIMPAIQAAIVQKAGGNLLFHVRTCPTARQTVLAAETETSFTNVPVKSSDLSVNRAKKNREKNSPDFFCILLLAAGVALFAFF